MGNLGLTPDKIHIINLPELLLLPRMICNIKVFDSYVIDVIIDAFSNDRIVGLIQTRYERFAHEKLFEKIGIACRIKSFQEKSLNEETYVEITLEGLCRFTVIDWLISEQTKMVKAYVDYKKFDSDFGILPPSKINREMLMKGFRRYLSHHHQDINLSRFSQVSDQLLIDSISMSLDFTPEQRQTLLESVDFNDRAMLLMDIFYIDHPVPQGFDADLGLKI